MPKPGRRRIYPRKTQIVLQAAEQAFIEGGYGGVSVDAIAELAGVSKRTVYNNFENKEGLFAAVIQARCDKVVPPPVSEKAMQHDPEEELVRLAINFLRALYAPEQIALYQTIVANSRQFPEVGRIMFEGPILRSQSVFDAYLRQQVTLGRMHFPELDVAAAQLVALLKTNVHMRLLFNQPVPLTEAVIRKIARASIRLFLYGAMRKEGSTSKEPPAKRPRRPAKANGQVSQNVADNN